MNTTIRTKKPTYPRGTMDAYLQEPTGLNTQDNAVLIGNIFRHHCERPDLGPDEILAMRAKDARLTLEMIQRVYWLVHQDRLRDLTPDPMNSFRRAISTDKREIPAPVEIPGISPDDAKMIMAILMRKPRPAEAQNGKPTEIYEADQLAMIFHLTRIGASRNAIATSFWHPATTNAIRAMHFIVRNHYVYHKGWNWVDKERPALQPRV